MAAARRSGRASAGRRPGARHRADSPTRVRVRLRPPRRGRWDPEPATLQLTDPLRLHTAELRGESAGSVLVLPRIEPVIVRDGPGGGRGDGLLDGLDGLGAAGHRHPADRLRARRPCAPTVRGAPASRIHWPTVARSREMLEHRLVAGANASPLVVLDSSHPSDLEALDRAVRAAASLCVHLAPSRGCALLLAGERPPRQIDRQLQAWPRAHARLAMVEAGGPPPGMRRVPGAGVVFWVTASRDAPAERLLAAGASYLVSAGAARRRGDVHGGGMSWAAPRARAGPCGGGGMTDTRIPQQSHPADRVRRPRRVCGGQLGRAGLGPAARAHRPGRASRHRRGGRAHVARRAPVEGRRPRRGAAVAIVAVVAASVAMGLPVRLLAPPNWDQLGHELGGALRGLSALAYPYRGGAEWSRLVILLGLPVSLGLAAALAFWPARRAVASLRVAALVVLVVTYGVGATVSPPGAPLLHGIVLLALLAAWLWLPGLEGSQSDRRGHARGGGRAPRAAGGESARRRPALARLPELELERVGDRRWRVVRLEPHLRAPRLDANGRDAARRLERCTPLLAHRGARPLRRLSLAGDHGQRERRGGAPAQPHRLPVQPADRAPEPELDPHPQLHDPRAQQPTRRRRREPPWA